MNMHTPENCERIEAMLPAFVEGGLAADDAAAVRAHVESCAACGEALAAFTALEASLVLRRDEVPALDAFLPDFAAVRAAARGAVAPAARGGAWRAHPRLVWALRGMMSVPGVAIILTMWSALLLYHFREPVSRVFAWTSPERFSAINNQISSALVGVSGGDSYTLIAIYLALAMAVLASTGAITLRFIRNH